jgi:hypothetical protein
MYYDLTVDQVSKMKISDRNKIDFKPIPTGYDFFKNANS